MHLEKIEFETIKKIWETKLWRDRISAIKPMSSMQWNGGIDMSIYDKYEPTFFGVYDGDKLVGVNSGFRTKDTLYRSRGIWVDPDYRGQGVAQKLFEALDAVALNEGCVEIWSIPRKDALVAYLRAGYVQVGSFFDEGMEFGPNCYVLKKIWK